ELPGLHLLGELVDRFVVLGGALGVLRLERVALLGQRRLLGLEVLDVGLELGVLIGELCGLRLKLLLLVLESVGLDLELLVLRARDASNGHEAEEDGYRDSERGLHRGLLSTGSSHRRYLVRGSRVRAERGDKRWMPCRRGRVAQESPG